MAQKSGNCCFPPSRSDLTVALGANGGAAMIAAPADDLTNDVIVAAGAGGVCGARQHGTGKEAGA